MTYSRLLVISVAALATGASICALQKSTSQQIPEVLKLTGDLEGVHDPAILKEGDIYYVYCTGGGRDGLGHPKVTLPARFQRAGNGSRAIIKSLCPSTPSSSLCTTSRRPSPHSPRSE